MMQAARHPHIKHPEPDKPDTDVTPPAKGRVDDLERRRREAPVTRDVDREPDAADRGSSLQEPGEPVERDDTASARDEGIE